MGTDNRFKALISLLIFAAACLSPITAQAISAPRYAAILVSERTGETLFASDPDLQVHPASITKMMTLYLAFEALEQGQLRMSDRVVFSRRAVNQRPSRLAVPLGKSLSVDEVIRAIAVKSANDAAVALAERIEGTEEAFAARMTRTARAMGMRNTTYVNASGLPNKQQLTTARDIATLSARLIRRFPTQYRYFGTKNFQYAASSWVNHNHLLGKVPGVDGIKTGFTNDAGFTLAASAQRQGTRLIAVVLGAKSSRSRDVDVTSLLDLGFDTLDRRRFGERVEVSSYFRPGGLGVPVRARTIEQGSDDPDADAAAAKAKAAKKKAAKAEAAKKEVTKKAAAKKSATAKRKSSSSKATAQKSSSKKAVKTAAAKKTSTKKATKTASAKSKANKSESKVAATKAATTKKTAAKSDTAKDSKTKKAIANKDADKASTKKSNKVVARTQKADQG